MKYLITVCSFILFSQLSLAQEPGDLDPTFGGGDGIKEINFLENNPERLFPIVVDDQDRILTTGQTYDQSSDGSGNFFNQKIIVARLTPDGSYDSTFADGGHGVYDLPINGENALDMTMQGNEILISGYGEEENFVFRLKESGEIDSSFGNDGIVLLPNYGHNCYLTTDNEGNI
jgi:hypothetical protein